MENRNTVVKKNTLCLLSLEGEGGTPCRVRGKVHQANLMGTPSSALRTSSPSRGKRPHGFTLIELLVVVLIIGILAAVAVPQYQKAAKKAYYQGMLPILASVVEAQKLYYMTHGKYAENATEMANLEIGFPITGTCDLTGLSFIQPQGDGARIGNYCVYLTGHSKTGVFIGLSNAKWGLIARNARMSGFEYLLASNLADRPAGKTYCRERFIMDSAPRDDFHCAGPIIQKNWDAAWFEME